MMQSNLHTKQNNTTKEKQLSTILLFLDSIGIKTTEEQLDHKTFLPGIYSETGIIYYDRYKLLYPGDLLHEAGHLACLSPKERKKVKGKIEPKNGEDMEMGAILWSYFACKNIGLPLRVVFHEEGYKGYSEWLIENFEQGKYIGLPILRWVGIIEYFNSQLIHPELPSINKWIRE